VCVGTDRDERGCKDTRSDWGGDDYSRGRFGFNRGVRKKGSRRHPVGNPIPLLDYAEAKRDPRKELDDDETHSG